MAVSIDISYSQVSGTHFFLG